jgi:hypothetical protein
MNPLIKIQFGTSIYMFYVVLQAKSTLNFVVFRNNRHGSGGSSDLMTRRAQSFALSLLSASQLGG